MGVALVSDRPEKPEAEQKDKEFKDKGSTVPEERKYIPPNHKQDTRR